ncbi:MAG: GNAT family N-acetyltransferase [Alphaproteobacteria bacterium]
MTRTDPTVRAIADQDAATQAALLALNNAHARETSHLEPAQWRALVEAAFLAGCIDGAAAFLIALGPDAAYDNANFRWFQARHERFVYVDRVIVAKARRGRRLAQTLYGELFRRAAAAGVDTVGCEINVEPPNPASDAFHARLGFIEVGRATLPDRGKTVRYLTRQLG